MTAVPESPAAYGQAAAPRAWSPRIDAIRQRSLAFADSQPRGERLRLVTESYRQTEGEPAILRRAKALAHVLARNVIRLYPGDRLAGLPQRFVFHTEALHAFDPDARFKPLDFPELHGGHFPHADKVTDSELQACLAYWQAAPGVRSAAGARFTPEMRKAVQLGALQGSGVFAGHCAVNYRKALRVGLEGLKQEARERHERGDVDERGRNFLEAIRISCDAVIHWAHRYADVAQQLLCLGSCSPRGVAKHYRYNGAT